MKVPVTYLLTALFFALSTTACGTYGQRCDLALRGEIRCECNGGHLVCFSIFLSIDGFTKASRFNVRAIIIPGLIGVGFCDWDLCSEGLTGLIERQGCFGLK
jgi:hypothetical protein